MFISTTLGLTFLKAKHTMQLFTSASLKRTIFFKKPKHTMQVRHFFPFGANRFVFSNTHHAIDQYCLTGGGIAFEAKHTILMFTPAPLGWLV